MILTGRKKIWIILKSLFNQLFVHPQTSGLKQYDQFLSFFFKKIDGFYAFVIFRWRMIKSRIDTFLLNNAYWAAHAIYSYIHVGACLCVPLEEKFVIFFKGPKLIWLNKKNKVTCTSCRTLFACLSLFVCTYCKKSSSRTVYINWLKL